MVRSSGKEELDTQQVFRVIGVIDGDIGYYTDSGRFGYDEFEGEFSTALVGNGALAVWADREGVEYDIQSKDVDLYTTPQMADLESFESLPLASRSREDGSQYHYNVSASHNRAATNLFIDIITDLEGAFACDPVQAERVEEMLEEDIRQSEPIFEGNIDVYLPSLEALRESFDFPELDYDDRLSMIDELQ